MQTILDATSVTYDNEGHVITVTTANGGVMTYGYDPSYRIQRRTDALGQAESWTWDSGGNLRIFTDRMGQASTYDAPDALGRFKKITYADGNTVTADVYDAGNRILQWTDTADGVLTHAFDGLDRMAQETSPRGTVSYTYDADGRRASMQANSQPMIRYTYDELDNLVGLSQGTESISFGYDVASRRTSMVLPNGVSAGYGYNDAGNATNINFIKGDTSIGTLSYDYDMDGRIMNRGGDLTMANAPSPYVSPSTFDINNRRSSRNGSVSSYDKNGNLTGDGVRSFVWDARQRLVAIRQGRTELASFAYDSTGRRTAKTINGQTTSYLYDGMRPVEIQQAGERYSILDGAGIDEHLAISTSAGRRYFVADLQGSTIALTNNAGAVVESYKYGAYGEVVQSNPSENPFQYVGRENDGTGLYYYRARYYEPTAGSFISEDPVTWGGGQSNFYSYVNGNPTSMVDPYGLFGWADMPIIPQPVLDFTTGVADAASLGLGPLARQALGVDGGVNRCSKAYSAGEWASLGLGAGRMAYAGIAKVGAAVAADGAAAMAFRNGLKRVMRGPLAGSNYRIKSYDDLLAKYGSDEAIQAAAGRTNSTVNAVGADLSIGGAVGASTCGCP